MAVFRRRQFSAEKGICHMSETTISTLPDPSGFSPDPLTDLIREGARKLIEQAVEAELATLLAHELAHLVLSHHIETLSSGSIVWPSVLSIVTDAVRAFLFPVTMLCECHPLSYH